MFSAPSEKEWLKTYAVGSEIDPVELAFNRGGECWTLLSRQPATSLDDALSHTSRIDEANRCMKLRINLDSDMNYGAVAKQLNKTNFACFLVELHNASTPHDVSSSFRDLERALFAEGFRKHPAYYALTGYEELNEASAKMVGAYVKLAPELAEMFSLEYLLDSRSLHMDMSREQGVRSDAHIIRYHFAAHEILKKFGENANILDACCGMGYGTALLSSICKGSCVSGVDIDERAVVYSQALYARSESCSFFQTPILDYLKLLATDSLDAVVMFEGLEHIQSVDETLEEINRVLAADGIFISSIPNQWVNEQGVDENEYHLSVFTWDSYRERLSGHLAVESTYCQVGSRVNDRGKWLPRERQFIAVPIEAFEPMEAEWWVAICCSRSNLAHFAEVHTVGSTFELQEALCLAKAPDIKVVSFDIFDTLLSRPTLSPTDVFHILQMQLVLERGEHFSRFADIRSLSEKRAREFAHKKGMGDITIQEIYACLSHLMALSEAETAELVAMELKLEDSLLKPRKGVADIYHAALSAGKKIIAVSDMYLPEDFLADLLKKNGYDQLHAVWCSSKHRVQKRTGLLYKAVLDDLAKMGVEPSEVLHIGDNFDSDIKGARQYGLQTLHTKKATERYAGPNHLWPSGPEIKDVSKIDLSLRCFKGCQIDAVFQDPFTLLKRGTIFNRDPYLYGRLRLAPLIYFAMLDFARLCKSTGVDRVYFVTRDGHLPSFAFEKIAHNIGLTVDVQPLHLSRAMFTLLQCESLEDFYRHLSVQVMSNKQYSVSCIVAKMIGTDEAQLLRHTFSSLSLPDQESLCVPLAIDSLMNYRALVERAWLVLQPLIKAKRTAFLSYLEEIDWSGKTAIWDVGYFHTIATVLDKKNIAINLSGHLVSISHHQSRVSQNTGRFLRHDYFGMINNSRDFNVFDTRRHSVLLELLLSDPSTSTRNTYTKRGAVVVQPELAEMRENNRSAIDAVHKGVIDAIEDYVSSYNTVLNSANCSPFQLLDLAFRPAAITELAEATNLIFDNDTRLSLAGILSK